MQRAKAYRFYSLTTYAVTAIAYTDLGYLKHKRVM